MNATNRIKSRFFSKCSFVILFFLKFSLIYKIQIKLIIFINIFFFTIRNISEKRVTNEHLYKNPVKSMAEAVTLSVTLFFEKSNK